MDPLTLKALRAAVGCGRRSHRPAIFGGLARLQLMLLAALALFLNGAASAEPIQVFVSILPQKYFAQRIAGRYAEIHVMVGPGDSPATYEPKPRQMSALSRARVYFEIGVPFERVWMSRLGAANREMRIVDTTEGIPLRASGDPHVWTNPAFSRLMAARMRDAFIGLDAAHAKDYERNYRLLAGDLARLDNDIRAQLLPYSGRAFLVFHASWGYFADAYGLRQIAIEAEGKAPAPRTLAATIDEARLLKCKVVFVQPQFSRATAEGVARELGARIVVIDPLEEDYIANLREVAAAMAEALAAS